MLLCDGDLLCEEDAAVLVLAALCPPYALACVAVAFGKQMLNQHPSGTGLSPQGRGQGHHGGHHQQKDQLGEAGSTPHAAEMMLMGYIKRRTASNCAGVHRCSGLVHQHTHRRQRAQVVYSRAEEASLW
jgi:hypothetical protein